MQVPALVAALVIGALAAAPAQAVHRARPATVPPSRVVQVGNARFEVLTPTLIRVEYAGDAAFEDLATETAMHRDQPVPAYTVTDTLGQLTIDTGSLRLHYAEGGPFTPGNLSVALTVAGTPTTAHPVRDPCQQAPSACGPSNGTPGTAGSDPTVIGGYTREAVSVDQGGHDVRSPLHAGMLNTNGWYLLDDTATALRPDGGTGVPLALPRPGHVGGYQDGYFFGYGHDYVTGLRDLNALTGPSVILPKWAFGPWFSNYQGYSEAEYTTIVDAFRSHHTPVDVLVVDTNWKSPDSWNGWDWNPSLFPDPGRLLRWATAGGLHTSLNIHPSIDVTDPHYPSAQATASGRIGTSSGDCQIYRQSPACYVFDWGDPQQAQAYFDLHRPLEAAGVSFFWLDWCCDASTVNDAGLTPDSWINDLYAARQVARGNRPFVLSRIGSGIYSMNDITGVTNAPATGAWAAHRDTIGFTGNATSDWDTLAFEARLTPAEGAAIGFPYVSNDIGGYTVAHLPDDLYARWVQLGAFSPILRLHGEHAERTPWQYPGAAQTSAERFLRLREALVPYLYTAAAQSHDSGLPMTRAMVLAYPDQPAAAAATDQWLLGDSLLVAPITSAGTTASRNVWIPPGAWTDLFTGETVTGPTTVNVTQGLDRAPVWVRGGGIVALAPAMDHLGARPEDPLTLRVGAGAPGTSSLYEDAGDGLGYEHGERAATPLRYDEPAPGAGRLVVGARHGTFPGASTERAYAVQFLASARPHNVTFDGVEIPAVTDDPPRDATATSADVPSADRWSYDPATRIITAMVAPRSTSGQVVVAHDEPAESAAPALPESPSVPLLLAGSTLLARAIVLVSRRRRRAADPLSVRTLSPRRRREASGNTGYTHLRATQLTGLH